MGHPNSLSERRGVVTPSLPSRGITGGPAECSTWSSSTAARADCCSAPKPEACGSLDPDNNSLPLSNTWNNPNVNCLAAGPDGPRHFFAGCDGGVIYETDASHAVPLLEWASAALAEAPGDVYDIVVLPSQRLIIAACADGLYSSTIPPATTRGPSVVRMDARGRSRCEAERILHCRGRLDDGESARTTSRPGEGHQHRRGRADGGRLHRPVGWRQAVPAAGRDRRRGFLSNATAPPRLRPASIFRKRCMPLAQCPTGCCT